MRQIYADELNILWENYKSMIDVIGFYDMIEGITTDLQEKFKIPLSELDFQNKQKNKDKPLGKIRYGLLKNRRIISLLVRDGIIELDCDIYYIKGDKYGSFPKFTKANPTIYPSVKMIQKMQIKVLIKHCEEYNISNRRELRNNLMKEWKINKDRATYLERVYGVIQKNNDINSFIQDVDVEKDNFSE